MRGVDHLGVRGGSLAGKLPERVFPDANLTNAACIAATCSAGSFRSARMKFFWALASGVGEGGAAFGPPLRRPLLLICSRLLLKLSFGRSLGLSLQFGLGPPDP
jgi:hypothetical protein